LFRIQNTGLVLHAKRRLMRFMIKSQYWEILQHNLPSDKPE
jgi:hypothetical protein